jgi:hypothetical protein
VNAGAGTARLLAAPALRAERRIRLGRSFDRGATALCIALLVAAAALVLRKTGHLSEATTRAVLAVAALAAVGASVVAYLRPLAERAGAVALDRHHGLSDRLSSALSFAALPARDRTPFMDLAILDAAAVVGSVDPRRAVPLRLPRDAMAALLLAVATLGIGLFEVRRHEVVVAAQTIDAVDVTADDLDALRDFLKDIEQRDSSEVMKAATEEFNQLIADLAARRLDRTEAFRRMQALEDKLLEGALADHKVLEAALGKIGDELKKAELTRPAGAALTNDHLADAEKALRDLADKLRREGKGVGKDQLDRLREALKRAAESNARQQEAIAERREQLKQELLREKKRQAERDGGANDEERSLLQKKERELERLDREQEQAEAAGRQLDRLDRELEQAAADLMRDLGATANDLDQGAEDINRMARQEMTQEEKEQLKQKIDELREMIRQQGQGGQKQMVRLRRFQAGARGQGQSGQGQGQGDQGEDGQSGDGQQGHAGQHPGQAGQGEGQQGHAGQGQPGPGQGGGQGQQGASGGELWVVGPNGEKMLMISRGSGRSGAGAGGESHGGGGEPKGGPGWGTEHDEHVQGQARSIKSATEDTQVAGQDSSQGGSRSEVIQGAAERGFTSRGYQKVYREYRTVAEEALTRDEIPGGYRSYIRRYFELIRPREPK